MCKRRQSEHSRSFFKLIGGYIRILTTINNLSLRPRPRTNFTNIQATTPLSDHKTLSQQPTLLSDPNRSTQYLTQAFSPFPTGFSIFLENFPSITSNLKLLSAKSFSVGKAENFDNQHFFFHNVFYSSRDKFQFYIHFCNLNLNYGILKFCCFVKR